MYYFTKYSLRGYLAEKETPGTIVHWYANNSAVAESFCYHMLKRAAMNTFKKRGLGKMIVSYISYKRFLLLKPILK